MGRGQGICLLVVVVLLVGRVSDGHALQYIWGTEVRRYEDVGIHVSLRFWWDCMS